MRQFRGLATLAQRVSSDLPGVLARGAELLWERTGNFTEGLKVAKQRILAAFFQTTDHCNARCIMCAAKLMRRKRQIMPMDVYCRAVEQFAEAKGHSLMLSAFGEPLLDPHLVERVGFATRFPSIRNIGFTTNGSLLTAERYEALAENGLKNISISIDGFNKEAYEKVRAGLYFENLERNMEELLRAHEAMGRPIALHVSSFTREKPKHLLASPLYRQLVEAGITPGLKWRVDNWGGLISNIDGDLWLMDVPRRHGPCALLYDSSILILPDGRVTPCHCRDLEGDLQIGSIQDRSIQRIWLGEPLRSLRQEQRNGTFRPPCKDCSAYISLRSWFTRSRVRSLVDWNQQVPLGRNNPQQPVWQKSCENAHSSGY